MALTPRIALLHVVFPRGRDHVVHRDGGFAFSLIVLAIVTLNGNEWSRGVTALPCSRVRMTAISWFLSQELGTLGCQVHVATKGVQVHSFNGGGGVAQLGVERSRILHILLRVEARGEVPIAQVSWVSTGFDGYELLPFQLLGPFGWVEPSIGQPPHPTKLAKFSKMVIAHPCEE